MSVVYQKNSNMRRYLFSSENVSGGHPDKLCDYVSDSVLDAVMTLDPLGRVACETSVKNNTMFVFGEITCAKELNIESIARNAAKEIGYDSIDKGFDYKNCQIIICIDKQSNEIKQAVDSNDLENLGAGDQGIMFGYATNEHESLMPVTYVLATTLLKVLEEKRNDGTLPWSRPDAKAQVTVEYEQTDDGLKAIRVDTILMSVQHSPDVTQEQIKQDLQDHVISKVVPGYMMNEKTKLHLNPSGSFIVGGPTGDSGLTGRKIICDTYGGWGGHGGIFFKS